MMTQRLYGFGARDHRFLMAWLGMVVLFWILLLFLLPASRHAPPFPAATRARIANSTEALWRYTGHRPGDGEVLRVAIRRADRQRQTRLIAYLGDENAPDPSRVFYISHQIDSPTNVNLLHFDLQPWSDEDHLWIGWNYFPGSAIWAERGDPAFAGFAPQLAWRNRGEARFRFLRQDWIPGIAASIVTAESPHVTARLPFRALAGYTLVLFAAALFLPGYRTWWSCAVILHLALFVKALEVLFPSAWLWGGYHYSRMSSYPFWAGLVLVQTLAFPPILFKAMMPARAAFLVLSARRMRRWGVACVIVATGLSLTYFAARNWSRGIYGDGFGALGFPGYDYHNPFATALYHLFRSVMVWAAGQGWVDGNFGYADFFLMPRFIVSFMPLYILSAGLLASEIGRNPRQKILVYLLLLLVKPILTLFGYMEVYGPVIALQAFLAWTILRAFRLNNLLLPTGLSFFSYLFHMSGALVLPAILGLWWQGLHRSRSRISWLLTRIPAALFLALLLWLLCLGTLYIFKHDQEMTSFRAHVPAPRVEGLEWFHGLPMLYGSTGRTKREVFLSWGANPYPVHEYTVQSKEHITQISGALLFTAGPILPWLLLLAAVAMKTARPRTLYWSLLATALAMLAGAVLLASSFPYPKDWDLFSAQTVWWLAVLSWVLCRGRAVNDKVVNWMLVALLLYLLWDTVPWIYYNLTWGPAAHEREFVFF